MKEAVRRMQRTLSLDEAESVRLDLEARYVPNQVVKPGAGELVAELVAGVPVASEAGTNESWELLAQLAAGAVPPTSARVEDVDRVRAEFSAVIDAAAVCLGSALASPTDYLVVDVLDAAIEFLNEPQRKVALDALREFAGRGEREQRRVQVIISGIQGD
ncbi:hypothetical protein [Isoptericola sp. NPDC055881]